MSKIELGDEVADGEALDELLSSLSEKLDSDERHREAVVMACEPSPRGFMKLLYERAKQYGLDVSL